jgi:hypothetical protein
LQFAAARPWNYDGKLQFVERCSDWGVMHYLT